MKLGDLKIKGPIQKKIYLTHSETYTTFYQIISDETCVINKLNLIMIPADHMLQTVRILDILVMAFQATFQLK